MVLTIWMALAAAWILFLVPVLALRRRVDRYAWPAWQLTLRGEVADHFAYLREVLDGNAELVADMLAVAERHHARGATTTARTRLGQLFRMVDSFVERARVRLDEWLVVCRAALALYPLPPLPRGAFELRALRGLGAVERAAHIVAVTSGERFRLRLRVLDWGFRLLAWTARRRVRRLGRRPAHAVARGDWRRAHAVTHDFEALSYETLGAARGLLAAVETADARRK